MGHDFVKLSSVRLLNFERSQLEFLDKLDGVLGDLEAIQLAQLLLALLLLLLQSTDVRLVR